MKKRTSFLLIVFIALLCGRVAPTVDRKDSIDVTISGARQYQKTTIALIVLDEGAKTDELDTIAQALKKDLTFTRQIDVNMVSKTPTLYKKYMTNCAQQGCPLAIVIKHGKKEGTLVWWLYDTMSNILLAHNTYEKSGKLVRGWAHALADQVWPKIIGQEGFFSTKIAYCKERLLKRGERVSRVKHICIADYDGSHEQILVKTPTVNVAPRWNNDVKYPLLFYSESTNQNMRLVVVNMKGQRKIASSFDGLNMLPSFSRDGEKVVYCASRGSGDCHIYYYQKGQFKRITHNNGNNVSPSLSGDGTQLFFCSDFQTGYPQIYSYDLKTKEQKRLTSGGYCAAPAYCQKTNKLVYSKLVNGVMQLMLYDCAADQHAQLTFDAGNKQEASWSPCGNYLLFNISNRRSSRLAFLSLATKKYRFLTDNKIICSYPHWSPIYASFPVVS